MFGLQKTGETPVTEFLRGRALGAFGIVEKHLAAAALSSATGRRSPTFRWSAISISPRKPASTAPPFPTSTPGPLGSPRCRLGASVRPDEAGLSRRLILGEFNGPVAAMEVFVRVIETGSFSAAARQLGVGQPAVSKTVAQLEARLAVRLLLRTSHGLTPTEAGTNFYERAKRSIEEADAADLAARGAGAGLNGRLRFSATVTFGRLEIMPRLPIFLAAHPALKVEAILDDRIVDLMEEGIDVALRTGRLPIGDDGADCRTIASIGAGHAILFRKSRRAPNPSRPDEA